MKKEPLKIRIFVGERALEELTDEERAAFGDRAAQRMGRALADWIRQNPAALELLPEK